MKKTGKIGSILCLLALLGLTGIYALPKVYVLYQANTGKVDICLKEYMLEEGKEVLDQTQGADILGIRFEFTDDPFDDQNGNGEDQKTDDSNTY